MRRLAGHYAAMRVEHPHDHLLVVFDIDGTILDMRHMVCHLLVAYDRAHGTERHGEVLDLGDDADHHAALARLWPEPAFADPPLKEAP